MAKLVMARGVMARGVMARGAWRWAMGAAVLVPLLLLPLPGDGGHAQDAPESLLPPGFGPPPPPLQDSDDPDDDLPPPPSADSLPLSRPPAPPGAEDGIIESAEPDPAANAQAEALAAALQAAVIAFDVPTRRSLAEIGVLAAAEGGMERGAYGAAGGAWLGTLTRHIDGPLVSRWGHIVARRALISRTATPMNIAGQDWAAERAWLLLRMGEAGAARMLVQQVDAGRFTPRLYEVAMQVMLANADPAGLCPLVEGANRVSDAADWRMARPICASLLGEQGRATALLSEGRRRGHARGVDYLLAEKAVGAGFNSRRSVRIEWDNVDGMNAWRFGLGMALGVEPPARLMQPLGAHVIAWRAMAPMLPAAARLPSAMVAARLGVMSNAALVDLHSAALADAADNDDVDDDARAALTMSRRLGDAYTGASAEARLAALRDLWGADREYAALVLTARAAATMPVGSASGVDAENIVAALLAAGLDAPAARWAGVLDEGTRGWAIVAAGAPDPLADSASGAAAYAGEGQSGAFLVAALAGLGRIDMDRAVAIAADEDFVLRHRSRWSDAIGRAAARGEQGTVALLAAAGMQARDWADIPAWQLYHIIRALAAVGLEAEARMIAAEAVTRA